LFENLVAINLKQNTRELFYWLNGVEIDFVTDKKAIQVTAIDRIPKREINAFEEFNKKFPKFENIIITPTTNKKTDNIITQDIISFLK